MTQCQPVCYGCIVSTFNDGGHSPGAAFQVISSKIVAVIKTGFVRYSLNSKIKYFQTPAKMSEKESLLNANQTTYRCTSNFPNIFVFVAIIKHYKTELLE